MSPVSCPVVNPEKIGVTICNMTHEEFAQLLEDTAKRGAKSALASVGLNDEAAACDIMAVRDLLRGFRLFRKEAWTVTIKGAGRVLGWAIVLGIAALFFKNGGPTVQQVAQKLAEP